MLVPVAFTGLAWRSSSICPSQRSNSACISSNCRHSSNMSSNWFFRWLKRVNASSQCSCNFSTEIQIYQWKHIAVCLLMKDKTWLLLVYVYIHMYRASPEHRSYTRIYISSVQPIMATDQQPALSCCVIFENLNLNFFSISDLLFWFLSILWPNSRFKNWLISNINNVLDS